MPYAVTHILIALIVADIIRDYLVKNKKKFPLHYVLIAGIAGLLPDADTIIYWVLNMLYNIPSSLVHRLYSHNLFIALIFLILGFLTIKAKNRSLSKHKLKLSMIFYMIALGYFVHLVLDYLLSGKIMPLFPFSTLKVGLELTAGKLGDSILQGIDAILLVLWLVHEEIKHRISDFI